MLLLLVDGDLVDEHVVLVLVEELPIGRKWLQIVKKV